MALALISDRTGFPALFRGMSATNMTSEGMAMGPKVFRTTFLISFSSAASAVASGANKVMTYAYGVAHALGLGEAALPILRGVLKGLKKLAQGKEYLQNVKHTKNLNVYLNMSYTIPSSLRYDLLPSLIGKEML